MDSIISVPQSLYPTRVRFGECLDLDTRSGNDANNELNQGRLA
jgi:hypothetical protein